jgi:apolipoprotein N-acyltransferase
VPGGLAAIAGRVAALAGWRRYAAAAALGGLLAAALPPLYLLPLAAVAFSGLVWLLDGAHGRRRQFFTAFAFAYGYFVPGLYWTGIAFFVDAARFAALVPLPVLGLPLLLALFPASGVAAAHALLPGGGPGRAAVLAVGWTLGEYARSHLFTGFPWNLVGYLWTVSDAVMQPAALIGVHGLGLLTVLLAALPATLADAAGPRRGAIWLGAGALGVAAMIGAGGLRLAVTDVAMVEGVRLRLVQPGIEQSLKWRDDRRAANFARHVELSLGPGAETVTHVIWPETAGPYFLDREPDLLAALAKVARQGLVLTGTPRRSNAGPAAPAVWNSLQAVDGAARVVGTYDKRHLVPFGEYLPFRPLLGRLGIDKLAVSAVDFSAGNGPQVLDLPGLPPVRPLICYEGIFADEILTAASPLPAWLLNVTNDGWFGISSGPYQHFAMARLRAVEQGLPLVRAANTGISAIVDPLGRVIGRLGLGQTGVVDGPLPAALPEGTVYARFGDLSALAIALIVAALWAVAKRRLA